MLRRFITFAVAIFFAFSGSAQDFTPQDFTLEQLSRMRFAYVDTSDSLYHLFDIEGKCLSDGYTDMEFFAPMSLYKSYYAVYDIDDEDPDEIPLYGVIDRDGKEIFPTKYSKVAIFDDFILLGKDDGQDDIRYSVATLEGVQRTGFIYDDFEPLYNYPYIWARTNERKECLLSANGREYVLPPVYDHIVVIDTLQAVVKKDGKWGLVALPGGDELVEIAADIPPRSEDLYFDMDNEISPGKVEALAFRIDGKWKVYSKGRQWELGEFPFLTAWGSDIVETADYIVPSRRNDYERGEGAYYNLEGKYLGPASKNSFEQTVDDTGYVIFDFNSAGKYSSVVRGYDGKVVIPQSAKMRIRTFFNEEGVACFKNEKDKMGMVDITGRIVAPPVYDYDGGDYDYLSPEDLYYPLEKDGHLALLDRKGRLALPLIYDPTPFVNAQKIGDETYFMVPKGGKWGVVTDKGREVVPFRFEILMYCDRNGIEYDDVDVEFMYDPSNTLIKVYNEGDSAGVLYDLDGNVMGAASFNPFNPDDDVTDYEEFSSQYDKEVWDYQVINGWYTFYLYNNYYNKLKE